MAMAAKYHNLAEAGASSSTALPASSHPALQSLNAAAAQFANVSGSANQQKYSLLLATIDEIGKQVRPAHTGNKNAIEQMKRHIAFAKLLIRELLVQVDHNLANIHARERRDLTLTSGSNAGINVSSSNLAMGMGMPPRKKPNYNTNSPRGAN